MNTEQKIKQLQDTIKPDHPKFHLYTRYIEANIPRPYWDLDNLNNYMQNKNVAEKILNFCKTSEKGKGLYVTGQSSNNVGQGKSALTYLAAQYFIKEGVIVYCFRMSELVPILRECHQNTNYELWMQLRDLIARTQIIVIDDFTDRYIGTTSFIANHITDFVEMVLYNWDLKRLFISSDLSFNKIRETFGTKLASFITERLILISISGKNIRNE